MQKTWYAVDKYEPLENTITRIHVGTLNGARMIMDQRASIPNTDFYRFLEITPEEASAFIDAGEVPVILDENRAELTLTEAAKALGLSRQRVHVLYKEGRLVGRMMGNTVVISRASIEGFKRDRMERDINGTA